MGLSRHVNGWRLVGAHLKQVAEHDERLLPDDGLVVSQTGGDVGDVVVHNVGVANAKVAHHHHHIVAHRHLGADLQLTGEHRQVLLDQLLVLETQFT